MKSIQKATCLHCAPSTAPAFPPYPYAGQTLTLTDPAAPGGSFSYRVLVEQ
jgi:hypothetical protein